MSITSVSNIEKLKNKVSISLSIEDIYKNIENCNKCELKNKLEVNKILVKSSGRKNAPIMIIGKNPSYKRRGDKCFGENDYINNPHLEKMLNRHKLSMKDVYSTNLVKCSTENNNDPNAYSDICSEFLFSEIVIINPKIILCAGKFVSNYIDKNKDKIDKNIIIKNISHPSSLSYNNDEESKEKYYKQLDEISEELKKIRNDMFTHLHFHDEYSIRDALGRIEDYTEIVKERHLQAFCTTNHGQVGGFIRQYFWCKKLNIKPIFGCEIYINNNRKEEVQKDLAKEDKKNKHLCIYAKNLEGFKNICKITSDAWINGFYYRPRTDLEFLKQYSNGVSASSACLAGPLTEFLEKDDYEGAAKILEEYKSIFEDFFIELLLIDYDFQKSMNSKLIKLAKITNTKTIITCDVHYMKKEWNNIHDTLILIRDNNTYQDIQNGKNVFLYRVKDLYFKNIDEIHETFKNGHESEYFTEEFFWKSIDNVFDFVYSINDIELDTTLKLPKFGDQSDELLKQKMFEGFDYRKLNRRNDKNYWDRMMYEYEVITKMGYTDYFLIIADIINWAKNNNIYVGAGRGSVSGSLISYLLRITEIDPIKYDLVFERFISFGRTDSFVDIDTDFDPNYRDDVKKYIIERFGQDNTCTVGTYGTFKSRATLLDVSRVNNIDLRETLNLTRNVIESDFDQSSFDDISKAYPLVKKYFEDYPQLLEPCNVIQGQIRNISKHAAGVIISDRKLSDHIPLMQTEGNIFSAFQEGSDFRELSTLGFIKFDILGLNNLAVIKNCIELIEQRHNIKLDFYNWQDMNDKASFELATKADTLGVFQFESRIARELLKKIEVDCFIDLSHISAVLRPGPLRAGVHEILAKRKNGQEKFEIPEILKDILQPTLGLMLYQENIMKIAERIGGFTLVESNDFRKALVKYGKSNAAESKRIEKAFSYKDKFISNAIKHISQEQAEDIFEKMLSFVSYGFNLGHAVSYAYISYVELYLKAHYFIEFLTALLNNTNRGKETAQKDSYLKMYINYAKENGIEVLNPDINKSQEKFSIIDNHTIMFGFSHIKGMGDKYHEIIENRYYKNFYDFFFKIKKKKIVEVSDNFFERIPNVKIKEEKSKINKTKVEALIYAGAFDEFNNDRSKLLNIYNTEINIDKKYIDKNLNKIELKEKEIEMLTLCLTQKNINDVFSQFAHKTNYTFPTEIKDLDIENCNVAGVLKKIDTNKKSKNNAKFYIQIQIEDDFNYISINCFKEADKKYVTQNLKEGMQITITSIKKFFGGSYSLTSDLEKCLTIRNF
jgi:DNA polymerase III subunit alpha